MTKRCLPGLIIASAIYTAPSYSMELRDQAVELAERLSGTLDSSVQALSQFSYFDVTIRSCPVKIENFQGELLYLEQAISLNQKNPYRVRFVQVLPNQKTGQIIVTNYGVNNEGDLRGLCQTSSTEIPELEAAFVGEKKCQVNVVKEGEVYRGKTPDEGCVNRARGAALVTAEVEVTEKGMTSWDRGWDLNGNQVWGAIEGPYKFRKTTDEAQDPLLVQFGTMLIGKLDNSIQHQANPDFMPIKYQICHIDSQDNPLAASDKMYYAEQELALEDREFTRQSIYHLSRDEAGKMILQAFKVKEGKEEAIKGICNQKLEDRLSVSEGVIEYKSNCQVNYSYNPKLNGFVGKTPEGGCPSNFQGSSYLELDEVIQNGKITVWERWYDSEGNQVAGSKVGPYIYIRSAYQQ